MSTTQDYFNLVVYAPALVGQAGRPLAVVHGIERAVPGLRLAWTTSEGGDLIALPDRDEWVASNSADGGFPFLCNDDDHHVVTLTGWESPTGPRSEPQFEVHARLPVNGAVVAAAIGILEVAAEGAHACWGHMTPFGAAGDIAEQTAPTLAGPPSPPRGLPALRLFQHIRAPEIPYYLGWINYWSAATARAIGFPDPARDADLLSRARRTATDGWVVQLTAAPLDLDNPSHLDALKWAYDRFPEIGGRATP